MIGQTLGHYRISEKLGEGGMGEVYLALDTELDRRVALKVLPQAVSNSDESLRRFRSEAKTLASLSHPNIVTIHSVESVDGVQFLTMELLEGKDLRDYIPRGGLSVPELFKIGIPLADALAAAHESNVIHRDLKPGNVIVTNKGQVKVVDFGLAKAIQDADQTVDPRAPTEPLTEEGRILGTVPYMAPEQLLGDEADQRSDIFSLGILLYEAATGRRPFRGKTKAEIQSSILRDIPVPVDQIKPSVPHHAARIISLCLEKDREARLQSAKDVRNELTALQQEISTGTSGSRTVVIPPSPRPKILRNLTAAALIAILGLTVWWILDGRTPPEPPQMSPEVQELLDQAEVHELRGLTRENLEEAEDRYRRALQLEPDNPLIQGRLARFLTELQLIYPDAEQREEARELARSALDQDPDQVEALLAVGNLALFDDELEEAERIGRKVIEVAPQNPFGYTLLGEALVKMGELDRGLEQLRKSVTLAGTDTRPRLALAWVLWQQGRTNEAAVEYEQVLEYNPDSPSGLNNLGTIYGQQGRYLEAIPLLRRLLRITDDADAAYNLANCYFYLDRLDDAISTYERVLEIDPEYLWAPHGLAEAHEKLGDRARAEDFYRQAIQSYDRWLEQSGPEAAYLGPRAVCAAKLGRYQESIENLREAEELSSASPTLLFQGAQIYALAGDETTMADYIERAIEAGYPRQEFEKDLAFASYLDDPGFRHILESTDSP
jgi:serine/threonine protein kinase/predicted TPR repeat methyltransferase